MLPGNVSLWKGFSELEMIPEAFTYVFRPSKAPFNGLCSSQTNSGIAKLAEWPEETPLGNSVQDRGPAVATLPSPSLYPSHPKGVFNPARRPPRKHVSCFNS